MLNLDSCVTAQQLNKIIIFVIDSCSTAPCQNGGTCYTSAADYLCRCKNGYSGKNCQTGKNYYSSRQKVKSFKTEGWIYIKCEFEVVRFFCHLITDLPFWIFLEVFVFSFFCFVIVVKYMKIVTVLFPFQYFRNPMIT